MTTYFPLWCKSNFSFLEGASHPEELVDACASLGLSGFALTDRDGVYGVVEAHMQARKLGVHLIIGSEITIEDGSNLILLAKNRLGYANLCRLITMGRRRSAKGTSVVGWREIFEHADDIIAVWGGDRSLLVGKAEPFFITHQLREAFGDRLYALVTRHRRAEEPAQEARLRRRARRYGLPIIAGMEVLYTGLRQSPENIARAARDEDVDVIGLSILSGAHHPICEKFAALRKDYGLEDKLWLVGGNIPAHDNDALKSVGVDAVFPTGSRFEEIVETIRTKTD